MTEPTEEQRATAHTLCQEMEKRMRALRLVTTAHYDTGMDLIARALADAEQHGYLRGLEDCGHILAPLDSLLAAAKEKK